MTLPEKVVIVGASLAGAKAAETLRSEGFAGQVMLLGEEPARPYERPPLSKAYLRGEADFEDAAVHPADFYVEQGIELRTGTRVAALDLGESAIELDSGERLAYDRLLLATGASPRRLGVPGSGFDGVHYLRSVADADRIRRTIGASEPVVVIGAGWIGCEVAASARQIGAEVTVVDSASLPLGRVLGSSIGAFYRDLHSDHGVRLRLGLGIESFGGTGRVEEVRLTDGTILPAGVVVVGVGVAPRTELAASAGLEIDNGVVTDEHLATSDPGVYAAGDVANAFHPTYGRRVRLEHWSSALNRGPVAATNLLGARTPYDKTPYFFSDQYDAGMEYWGLTADPEDVVIRGDPSGHELLAFWLEGDRVVAALNVNVWDKGDQLTELVTERPAVDRRRLADPEVDLSRIAGA